MKPRTNVLPNVILPGVILSLTVFLAACGGTVADTAPATPANPGAATGDQRVTVTWNSAAGATSYNVYWSTTSGTGTGGTVVNVTASPFYHDGVTNTTAYYYVITAVNGAGESSATSEVTATPADIFISSLSFTDANLEVCVINTGATFVHDLASLTCVASSIADITGIEALTSLTDLNLFVNSIVDISVLASLTNLTSLTLSNNNISDVSALNNLTGLTSLALSSNNLTAADINALLPNLTNLASLSLSGLSLGNAELSALGPNLIGLVGLIMANNSFTDVSPLASITSLTSLNLSNNSIVDVSPLASLSSLTTLNLYSNSVASVTPLASLIGMIDLTLAYNNITDVSPLASLTNISWVYLNNNNIGGQGVGNVDSLTALTSASDIGLINNIGMSCTELGTLIGTLGSPPVDTDNNSGTTDTATDGVNCTNP